MLNPVKTTGEVTTVSSVVNQDMSPEAAEVNACKLKSGGTLNLELLVPMLIVLDTGVPKEPITGFNVIEEMGKSGMSGCYHKGTERSFLYSPDTLCAARKPRVARHA
ncbi:hypothetical protein XENOCAPTIV_027166 [Xenoophorus captivus]|uniref:Uncharacterized protein n=1 Tax=Xenoophorus captivus TaxID=1517983 RepID=A0ABV0SH28_9TELE